MKHKYPDECPAFRLLVAPNPHCGGVGMDFEGKPCVWKMFGGTISDGTGRSFVELEINRDFYCWASVDDVKPLTPAAREIVKWCKGEL